MAYASVCDLQPWLGVDRPTQIQQDAMQRALDMAAQEIDWELGYDAVSPAPTPPPPLVVGVNIERAVEHYRALWSPFGVLQVPALDASAIVTARDSWWRHHLKLQSLKMSSGIA